MPDPGIEGFAVISGTRIIVPVEIASIDYSAQIPSIGTIGTIQFANISVGTVEVGTISIVLDVGTIGTIQAGLVTATICSGVVSLVGTVVGTLVPLESVGTIGTIQAGLICATIISGVVTVVGTILGTLKPLESVGTVGTILSPVAVVGTVQSLAASCVFTSVSATIKGSPGVLYQVNVSGESGIVAGPGTLLILNITATIGVVPVAAGGFVPVSFGPGVNFSTLIGSIIGSADATFVVR